MQRCRCCPKLLLAVVVGQLAWPACAAEPRELAVDQAALAARYERLESLALRIAELAEADDPVRAEQLRDVIRASRELAVADRFSMIVRLLESERLAAAGRDQQALAGELGRLMELLLADPREAKAEAERKRLAALLKDVKRFIKQQQRLRDALFDGERPAAIAGDQAELADQVERARRAATGPPKQPAVNPGPPGAESGQGRPGDPAETGPAAGEPAPTSGAGPDDPAARQPTGPHSTGPRQRAQPRLAEARRAMQAAAEQLRRDQTEDAQADQAAAQRSLEDARREVEQALEQLREEERVRLLTRLATRFRRMLAEQTEVNDLTKSAAEAAPDPPDRAARLAAGGLAQREEALAELAEGALRLLRDDGKSVAFPATVEQLRNDIRQTAVWLQSARLGAGTQRLQQEILKQLEDAVAAFEKAAADKKQQLAQARGQGQQAARSAPRLVDQLAELRMIRSLQARLLRRTELWNELVAGGEASTAEARQSLLDLSRDQQRLAEAAAELGEELAGR